MITIDLNKIRETLPKRAKVYLLKTKTGIFHIECIVRFPSLYDKGTKKEEQVIQKIFDQQRKVIGKDNISEFFVEETGSHWFIYLEKIPFEFINTGNPNGKRATKKKTVK